MPTVGTPRSAQQPFIALTFGEEDPVESPDFLLLRVNMHSQWMCSHLHIKRGSGLVDGKGALEDHHSSALL